VSIVLHTPSFVGMSLPSNTDAHVNTGSATRVSELTSLMTAAPQTNDAHVNTPSATCDSEQTSLLTTAHSADAAARASFVGICKVLIAQLMDMADDNITVWEMAESAYVLHPSVKITIIPQVQSSVPAAALKIPVFSKPFLSIATKHSIKNDEDATATVKKPKKQASASEQTQPRASEQTQPTPAPPPTKVAKANNQSKPSNLNPPGGASNSGISVEKLLLEAGVCWATFASFMASQKDGIAILQTLQVAQLKQVVKMNPKSSKISGTKNELVERIAALLRG